MVTVLLTGGLGYIGSHAAVVLASRGYRVVLYDNLQNSDISVLDRINVIVGTPLAFIHGDVRDTSCLEIVLKEHSVDAVLHFAGLKAVGESVREPIKYHDNNVLGALSLIKAMTNTGVKTLVFSSSATVYGNPQYLPCDEGHPTKATNPYGRTKLHIEEMLADVVSSDKRWRVICLRYFNPVGAHPSGLIGEEPVGIPNNLMPYIAAVASQNLNCLDVFGDDYDTRDGTGVRDYIHVMDLAEGHEAALSFLQRNTGWHVVNLGTGFGYTVLEMIQAFEAVSGKEIAYSIKDRRPGDAAESYADVVRSSELLGWRATRNITDICESIWLFHLHRQQQGV